MKYHEQFDDVESVRRILTEDWICRRNKNWPLVELLDFDNFQTYNRTRSKTGLCAVGGDSKYSYSKVFPSQENAYVKSLYQLFPSLSYILSKYQGKLAVCGGSLTRILTTTPDYYKNSKKHRHFANFDCDIFFYNTTVNEAQTILMDCVATMSSTDEIGTGFKTIVSRNDNVVNVVKFYSFSRNIQEKIKYQFILRIYPTLNSIIGGFDIGCCMVAFDGKKFYATPLGAWSIMKNANIVDTTRRSTSFEHRLVKYEKLGFSIVLPGMKTLERDLNEMNEKLQALKSFMFHNNLIFHDRENINVFANDCIFIGNKLALNDRYVKLSRKWLPIEWREGNPVNSDEILKKYSDYGSFDFSPGCDNPDGKTFTKETIEDIQGKMLRCNNRSSFFTCMEMPADYNDALDGFQMLTDSPIILYDLIRYQNHLTEFLEDNYSMDNRTAIGLMGEFFPEFNKLRKEGENLKSFETKVFDVMSKRMIENAILWKKDMTGLKWRTQNPGTQWTSSINPIMEDPRMFYGERYNRFMIGIPEEIAWTLLLIRRERGTFLYGLPRDLFNYLLDYSCMIWI